MGPIVKNFLFFLVGAISGVVIFIGVILPGALTSVGESVGLGVIAFAPIITVGGGILSILAGGVMGVILLNIVSGKKRVRKR